MKSGFILELRRSELCIYFRLFVRARRYVPTHVLVGSFRVWRDKDSPNLVLSLSDLTKLRLLHLLLKLHLINTSLTQFIESDAV